MNFGLGPNHSSARTISRVYPHPPQLIGPNRTIAHAAMNFRDNRLFANSFKIYE
jgi:hypothetical protein